MPAYGLNDLCVYDSKCVHVQISESFPGAAPARWLRLLFPALALAMLLA